MYDILVPVDMDEERVMRQAEYVTARPYDLSDVRARLLYVFPREDASLSDTRGFETNEAAVRAADELESAGVDVERVAATGTISRQIIDHAEDMDADEIVMGGRKRSGVSKVLLGSTASDIIHSTDRPVVITG